MSKDLKYSNVHYHNYLQLDKILDAQHLRSTQVGHEAHDEMLFIIVHQVYELWFKQINHELKSVVKCFKDHKVSERNVSLAVSRCDRVISIFRLLIEQIRVMETMTPLDFLDFRNYLFPASGFQSFQFREMEVMLGLKQTQRHTYNNTPYAEVFDDKRKDTLKKLEETESLAELINRWLERIPFLSWGDFNFVDAYKKAVGHMLDMEKEAIQNTDILSEEYKTMRLRMLGDTDSYFSTIWNQEQHEKSVEEGKLKFSYKATLSALFISLYREEPILNMPFRLLSRLMDIDEFLTTWRYRHAQMVLRMLGKKIGTGGSSGHEYLEKTAQKHKLFPDLHHISTLMIPRSDLPVLPVEFRKNLLFHFTVMSAEGDKN
jgi:tryptophan 2,3-dioxygenase